jgi:Holliday junction DNA helicase RuvB
MIIAAELGTGIRITSGPALERAGDLAALVSSLAEGEVLFIDEIHRIARPAEELLYVAMEDFRVDVVVGKGPARRRSRSRSRRSPSSARRRAAACSPARCATASASPPTWSRTPRPSSSRCSSAARACSRSRSGRTAPPRSPGGRAAPRASPTACCAASATTPRCGPTASSTGPVAQAALEVYDVDELGLDRLDREVLRRLVQRFGGGPVGLSTLAVAVSEERETVEEVAEPFLVRSGLILRTPRGRVATPAAWAHLGLRMPPARAPTPCR